MSAPPKPQQPGELPKLKTLWPTLHESAQEYWRAQFSSQRSQAEIRKELLAKLKVNLRWDNQLTNFRAWLFDQDTREAQAERMRENERRLIEQHPDWSLDKVREEVLKQSYFESLATGNFKLGLATVRQDLNCKKVSVDERKLALLEKKAEAFDKAKKVSDSKLTADEKEAEYRRIFGMT